MSNKDVYVNEIYYVGRRDGDNLNCSEHDPDTFLRHRVISAVVVVVEGLSSTK